jgi:hypothetical protein
LPPATAKTGRLAHRANAEPLLELGAERFHHHREAGVAPPGEADIHRGDRIRAADDLGALVRRWARSIGSAART